MSEQKPYKRVGQWVHGPHFSRVVSAVDAQWLPDALNAAYAAGLAAQRPAISVDKDAMLDKLMQAVREWEHYWNGRKSAGPAKITGNLKARLKKVLSSLPQPVGAEPVDPRGIALWWWARHYHPSDADQRVSDLEAFARHILAKGVQPQPSQNEPTDR